MFVWLAIVNVALINFKVQFAVYVMMLRVVVSGFGTTVLTFFSDLKPNNSPGCATESQ